MTITDRVIRFCLTNKLIVLMVGLLVLGWGVMVAPFNWDVGGLEVKTVPVDAIPDYGENQQIVFTSWMGRSPQDVEDQITYPLTVALLGIPNVKTIRSSSFFGFSSIYVIFDEEAEFYWSRSRLLEKLNSLPDGTLPDGVQPAIGPDATGLGQVFWYTLEGMDKDGNPTGGWGLDELRSVQDWQVRYALMSADGISEVASVGGYIKEYQIDVDPDAMRANGITLTEVFKAVKSSNVDVGARMIEVNSVEYIVRGLGFIESLSDIENTVIKANENVPIFIKDVAKVSFGPALRRGALDKAGAEAVGGVVVVRYGFNPLEAITNIKEKIAEISAGLPKKILPDGTESQVTVVPFYDRSGLIHETLGTLESSLTEEILVTIIVVIVLVLHFRSSILISGLLPVAVLMCFIAMKVFKVDANIVALSGIAIAIGTMVDMGIIICENILKHLDSAKDGESTLEVVYKAASEVGGAVVTAVSTTVVSFLPVFVMTGAEGKLFKPLAFTKTFALAASVIVALTMIPPAAQLLFGRKGQGRKLWQFVLAAVMISVGIWAGIRYDWWIGGIVVLIGGYNLLRPMLGASIISKTNNIINILAVLLVGIVLTRHWMPLGISNGIIRNFIMVAVLIGSLLIFFKFFQHFYPVILGWCLRHKLLFLCLPVVVIICGINIWRGLGKEFMPPLNEGSFLYMPSLMPHASIGEAMDVLSRQDAAFASIPEVESVVGKIGRAETPLDPAPISMIETVINYKPEYALDKDGRKIRYAYDRVKDEYLRDEKGYLIEDKKGRPFRQWRDHIKSAKDIWHEIEFAGRMPGTTGAPPLQPIETRLVMLQSGIRANMAVKINGPDLETIEAVGLKIEKMLKSGAVEGVNTGVVSADRIVGKPYLEIDIDRTAIARYGISVRTVQDVIEVAIGGKTITTTVEGRERYPVRVRYMRELRDSLETIGEILVPGGGGVQIPLIQLADINYVRGPAVIKSIDTALVGYVLFDKMEGFAEVDVVNSCKEFLKDKQSTGELELPDGVHYSFAGSYENQMRAQKTLTLVVPLALFIIFMILYMQFKSVSTSMLVFSGILVAWGGGFIMIWLYGQNWFLDFGVFGVNMRDLFQIHPINLSVAIWVGFLALFGIASDDGVVMCTYLEQTFASRKITSVDEIRKGVI
ncbi:MAG: efflux RND transporter permease subunit, partial [Anaerohalosphaera sp.]|nr:efflux RND transporter permease subunit [Anaerohalosphaera sp.]